MAVENLNDVQKDNEAPSDSAPEVLNAPDTAGTASAPAPEIKGAKENLYDKIPLTLKQLDIIIAILIVAFVVFFVIGTLKGNGVI